MRLIVKEKKALKENNPKEVATSWKVKTDPANFLILAKADKTGNVQSRASAYGKFDAEQAGFMQLVIDPVYGKVLSHDGRARSQTAINSGVEEIEISIKIDTSKTDKQFSWDKLPQYFLAEDGREEYVKKSEFKLKEESAEVSFDDILRLGGKDKIFAYEVVQNPRGPYVKQDPNRDAPIWVGARYTEYFTPMLRKAAGVPPTADLPMPVLDALKKYRSLINTQYKFTDDKGELRIVQNNPPHGSTHKFDRETIGNVVMSPR